MSSFSCVFWLPSLHIMLSLSNWKLEHGINFFWLCNPCITRIMPMSSKNLTLSWKLSDWKMILCLGKLVKKFSANYNFKTIYLWPINRIYSQIGTSRHEGLSECPRVLFYPGLGIQENRFGYLAGLSPFGGFVHWVLCMYLLWRDLSGWFVCEIWWAPGYLGGAGMCFLRLRL